MMSLVVAVLFLILASCSANKYLHPFQQYHQMKDPYPIEGRDDDESTGLLARLTDRLRATGDAEGPGGWDSVPDPRLYVLTQLESQSAPYQVDNGLKEESRSKRRGASLSIVNPLEVLQEKWLLNINRKQKEQIQTNRDLFSKIGKRKGYPAAANSVFNETPPRYLYPFQN